MADDGGEGGAAAAAADGSVEVRPQPLQQSPLSRLRRLCVAKLRRPNRTMVAVLGGQMALVAIGLGVILLTSSDTPEDASVAVVPRPAHLPVVLSLLLLLTLCVVAIVGVFVSSPLLCLPFLVLDVAATLAIGVATANAVRLVFVIFRGAHVAIAIALVLVLIFMVASLAVQTAYIRREVKNKKAVTGCPDPSAKQAETSPPESKSMTKFESFSRRSTLIISDDFYIPPPKA